MNSHQRRIRRRARRREIRDALGGLTEGEVALAIARTIASFPEMVQALVKAIEADSHRMAQRLESMGVRPIESKNDNGGQNDE